jgi:putative membrane protein
MHLFDAGLAWLHFVFAFVLVGALAAEAFVLRLPVDGRVARLLSRIDLFYGISAGLVIMAGVSRAIWGAKGWDYYQGQPFFWAKLAMFAIIGVLSVPPTLAFMRWSRAARADSNFMVPEAATKRVRLLVVIETHLIAVLLLFAVLMARGIGFSG